MRVIKLQLSYVLQDGLDYDYEASIYTVFWPSLLLGDNAAHFVIRPMHIAYCSKERLGYIAKLFSDAWSSLAAIVEMFVSC